MKLIGYLEEYWIIDPQNNGHYAGWALNHTNVQECGADKAQIFRLKNNLNIVHGSAASKLHPICIRKGTMVRRIVSPMNGK